MNSRITYIDNLRAFCLILMILGHAGLTLGQKNVIYSFHMPIFYFLSGILYHGTNNSIWHYFRKKAFRVVLPYCIWVLIFYFAAFVWHKVPYRNSLSEAFLYGLGIQGGGGALWFLTSLFWTYVFSAMRHRLHIPSWLWLIITFALWWCTMEYDIKPWFGINMAGPFFFTIGEFCNRLPLWLSTQNLGKLKWTFTAIALAAAYSAGMAWGGFPNHQVFNIAYMSHNIGSLLAACTACVALLFIFHALPKCTTINIISRYISSHAIIIVAIHFVPILVAKQYGLRSHFTHWEYIGIVMLMELIWLIPTTYLIGRFLPILNGETFKKKK